MPVLSPLTGCSVAAGSALVWVWWISWQQDADETERLAGEESRSRSTDARVVLARVASLVAVAVARVQVALGHALLSYPFGTAVVAVAINLVTNLRH